MGGGGLYNISVLYKLASPNSCLVEYTNFKLCMIYLIQQKYCLSSDAILKEYKCMKTKTLDSPRIYNNILVKNH